MAKSVKCHSILLLETTAILSPLTIPKSINPRLNLTDFSVNSFDERETHLLFSFCVKASFLGWLFN